MASNSQEQESFTLQRSSAESDKSDPDFDASPESSDVEQICTGTNFFI